MPEGKAPDRSQEALAATELRYRTMLEGVEAGVIVHATHTGITAFNKKACELFGVSADQMYTRDPSEAIWRRVYPDGSPIPPSELPLARALASGQPVRGMVLGLNRGPAAERVWLLVNANPILDEGGAIREVIVTAMDVTARIQAEGALAESEKRFKALFEQAAVGVGQLAIGTGRFLAVNKRLATIVGHTQEQLTRMNFTDIAHSDGSADNGALLRELQSGRTREFTTERPYRRVDGSEVWISLTLSAMWTPGDKPDSLVAVVQDITERKLLEGQLRHTQKMEAIGRLSAGVAHDFNNLLTVIKGHVGLLGIKQLVVPEIANSIKQIDEAAERAAKLTRQLLTFSRQEVLHLKEQNLNDAAGNMTKMLRRLVPESITMRVQTSPALPLVRADESMIEQVLLNLVVNARDAMPGTGEITVRVDCVELTAFEALAHPAAKEGSFVSLSVSDTGVGIPPEVIPRIFEPYFTTKEADKGTGLGLAMVYGIMQQHNGWIQVESTPGVGSVFRAFFPRLFAAAASASTRAQDKEVRIHGGHETIFLVEDDPSVRAMTEASLRGLGYQVICAPSGRAALQLWQAHRHEIDLLVTDLVMPGGVDGAALALILRTDNPKLPVLYTSGYSESHSGDGLVFREGHNYLPKPFGLPSLARTVRKSLDRGATMPPFG
ncbi:MAG: hypothetical protein JWQ83_2226 [Lacunisphaera sp.]|nr:hypothetical protein [Lacunisphaera sp.]MDB6167086.1 hypothetical protein [Lacunisphaera sp.]